MKGRVCDMFPKLEVGMKVSARYMWQRIDEIITGEIGIIEDSYIPGRKRIWVFTDDFAFDPSTLGDVDDCYRRAQAGAKSCGYNCAALFMSSEVVEIEILPMSISTTKEGTKMSLSLTERFKQKFLAEPSKSFVKAGITDINGSLTSEGLRLLDLWLLKKFGAEFKGEVVDELLADMNKEKNRE
jgi:hypothetical protein